MQCQKLKTYMQTGRVVFLPVNAIQPNPAQPRTLFSLTALEELAQSIRIHGVLQPLSVRRVDNAYELVAGERRLRAARMAGLTEVPCLLVQMTDQESSLIALLENLQREDLDFIEEAKGISRLITQWSMSQEQAARTLGKSQSAIANKLRLLRHSDRVLDALRQAQLTERHARALLRLPDEKQKLDAIGVISKAGMSVARTEAYIESLLREELQKPPKANIGIFLKNMNDTLAKIRRCGIPAISEQKETEDQIVLTITIPK